MSLERLEKVIAHRGLASRREAKDLIRSGVVMVNNAVITEPGFGIDPTKDAIVLKVQSPKESVLIYKPKGIETTKTTPNAQDMHDRFPAYKHLAPIGRLDKETEGLIIMTNDGVLTKALTKVDSSIGKIYSVRVRENVSDASIQRMSRGIMLDDTMTKPAIVKRVSRTSFTITLHEGRKHQIRRMCDACHLTIVSLCRVAIGHLTIGAMKSGSSKKLSATDVSLLKK